LQINEVTREEVGQMNRPTLHQPTLDRPTLDRPAPNRSILVEVHTLEFRGENYEDMSEGQGIDRFEFFIREMSSVVKKVQDSRSDRKSDRDTFDRRWSGRYNFAGVMDGKSYFKEILPNSIRIKTRCFNNFNN